MTMNYVPDRAAHPDGAGHPMIVLADGAPVRVILRGEIDLASHDLLRQVLEDVLNGSDGDVRVDVTQLRFCDAGTVGALIATEAQLRMVGRRLTVGEVPERIRRVLELADAGWLLG
jgi:anti-anti-sigma factor